jgi:hypothetical protein
MPDPEDPDGVTPSAGSGAGGSGPPAQDERAADRNAGLLRWRFWESRDWEALLERLAMRGFWLAFGVILVFALVYAINGFPFNRVFETVIALAGAALIFAFALKSNDGVMRFLGMMLIAALIISPDDILRLARSLQNQEETQRDANVEAEVRRFNVFDTRTVALDLHALLEEFDHELTREGGDGGQGAGGKFGNIATIDDEVLRGFIGCVLDDAVARSIASSMRSSELYQTYRTLLLDRFHEIDFRAPDRDEIDANLDDLKALGVLDYPESQRDQFVLTRLGCRVIWEFDSLRMEYRRRLREGAELPCRAELDFNEGPASNSAYLLPVSQTDARQAEIQSRRCIEAGLDEARLSGHVQTPAGYPLAYYQPEPALLDATLDELGDPVRVLDLASGDVVQQRVTVAENQWQLLELRGAGAGTRIEVRGQNGYDPVMRLFASDGRVIDTIDDSVQADGSYSWNPNFRVESGTEEPAYVAVRGFGFSAGDVVVWISRVGE